MNKRITSILLCFVMLFSMLVSAVPAYAAPANPPMVFIEADRTEANPGDTITYKFYLQQPDTMTAFAFNMVAPDGLTYVEGSGTLGSTAFAAWGSTFEWVPEADLQLQWYSSSGDDVTDTSKIELITIQFKVADDATIDAEYELSLTNMQLAAGSTQNYDDISSTVEVSTAKVKIVAKPVAVTGVTIDETMSLKTGESKDLTVTVLPEGATNKAVAFKVTEGDAATVDANGKVTGVKVGTATITVTTIDGGFKDTCVVTVECSHANKTATEEKASDCKTQGWDAYSTCDACGQLFNEAGEEIDKIPLRDLSTDHKYDNACDAECNVCNAARDVEDHKYDNAEDMICNECGYDRSCKHTDLTIVPEKESDCKTQGWDAYRECSCGKIFDMDDKELEKIPYRDLDMTKHTGGTATCKTLAVCSVCEKEYGELNADNHEGTADWVETDVPELMHHKEYDCCGAVVVSGNHVFEDENDMICDVCEYDRTCSHTGGTATCTEQAVCEKCSKPYGALAAHDFTKEDTKDDALKTKGDCGKEAVYFKSCTACGAVDDDENNTFRGEKDAANHADYGTYIDGYSAPDHKNQIDGHTGVEKCKECDYIFNQGEIIPAGEHVPSEEWQSDENNHWKVCSVEDCEFMFKETLDVHSTEKEENKATCQKQAVCDTCGVSYGEKAGHDFATGKDWSKDETGHWYDCKTPNCGEKTEFAQHTGMDGDKVCDDCGYDANCKHKDGLTHVPAVPAKCTEDGNIEYWYCKTCGVKFNGKDPETADTIENIADPQTGHDFSEVEDSSKAPSCTEEGWKSHFECENGCGTLAADEAGKDLITNLDAWRKGAGLIQKEPHIFTEEIKDDAHLDKNNLPVNCDDHYIYFKDCKNCDEIAISENDTFRGDVLGHNYIDKIQDEDHLRKEATNCQEKTSYWYDCSRCDANAKDDANATDKWYEIDQTGDHQYNEEEWGYKAEDGHAHKCILCGTSDDVIEHTPNIEEATEEQDKVCTECGYVIDTKKHVHTSTVVPGYAASCTSTGLTEGSKCTECGTVFVEQQIIPKLPHERGMTVVENVRLATPYYPGSYDFVVYCKNCHTELDRRTIIVPYSAPAVPEIPVVPETPVEPEAPHIHNYEDIDGYDPTCTETGLTDGVVCKDCGEFLIASEIIPATGHIYGAFVVENLIEATATEDGSYDLVSDCTVCGEELARVTIDLPATGEIENPDTADEANVNVFAISAVLMAVVTVAAVAVKKFFKVK